MCFEKSIFNEFGNIKEMNEFLDIVSSKSKSEGYTQAK